MDHVGSLNDLAVEGNDLRLDVTAARFDDNLIFELCLRHRITYRSYDIAPRYTTKILHITFPIPMAMTLPSGRFTHSLADGHWMSSRKEGWD